MLGFGRRARQKERRKRLFRLARSLTDMSETFSEQDMPAFAAELGAKAVDIALMVATNEIADRE